MHSKLYRCHNFHNPLPNLRKVIVYTNNFYYWMLHRFFSISVLWRMGSGFRIIIHCLFRCNLVMVDPTIFPKWGWHDEVLPILCRFMGGDKCSTSHFWWRLVICSYLRQWHANSHRLWWILYQLWYCKTVFSQVSASSCLNYGVFYFNITVTFLVVALVTPSATASRMDTISLLHVPLTLPVSPMCLQMVLAFLLSTPPLAYQSSNECLQTIKRFKK